MELVGVIEGAVLVDAARLNEIVKLIDETIIGEGLDEIGVE